MNIDKFGHHIHKRMRLTDILNVSENSIIKSDNGEFDLQKNRIRGVIDPVDADHVSNKRYIDNKVKDLCNKKDIQKFLDSTKQEIMNETQNSIEHLKAYLILYIDQNSKNLVTNKTDKYHHNDKTTSR